MRRLLAATILAVIAAALFFTWNGLQGNAGGGAIAPLSASEAPSPTTPDSAASNELEPPRLPTPQHAGDREAADELAPADTRAVAAPEAPDEDHDLRVRVVDPFGDPVVGLKLLLGPRDFEPTAEIAPVFEQSLTNADGLAVFAGQRPLAEAADPPRTLTHMVAFVERPKRLIDASALNEDPILTVQPAWGMAEVTVRDVDGGLAPDGSSVELSFIDPREGGQPMLAKERDAVQASTQGGVAHFDWLEPGREVEALAARPDSNVRSRSSTRAFVAAGGTLRLEVKLGADHGVLVFRALDPEGLPLRNAELRLDSLASFATQGNADRVTDEEGYLRLDARDSWIFGGEHWLVTHRPDDATVWRGLAHFDGKPELGLNRCGNVQLGPDPLLVAGRVVDASGAGMAGAEVVAGDQSAQRWRPHSWVQGETDANGGFELYGLLADEEFALSARGGGARSAELQVRTGETGVRLLLEPRWGVTGQLVCDEGVPPGELALELIAGGEGGQRYEAGHVAEDGRFTFEDVEAGTYELRCTLEGRVLKSLPGLAVAGDLDVGALDLRGAVHAFELVLVGAGQPSKLRGELRWRATGSEDEWRKQSIEAAHVQFLSPDPLIDLAVYVHGYRAARLTGVSGRREVRLQPALSVRIELVTDGPLPEYPYVLDADLYQDDAKVGWPEGPRHFTAQNRFASFSVATPGIVRVRWHFERHGDSWAIGGHVLEQREVEIEVLDIPGEQRIRVELDGAALRRLVEHPPF